MGVRRGLGIREGQRAKPSFPKIQNPLEGWFDIYCLWVFN